MRGYWHSREESLMVAIVREIDNVDAVSERFASRLLMRRGDRMLSGSY